MEHVKRWCGRRSCVYWLAVALSAVSGVGFAIGVVSRDQGMVLVSFSFWLVTVVVFVADKR